MQNLPKRNCTNCCTHKLHDKKRNLYEISESGIVLFCIHTNYTVKSGIYTKPLKAELYQLVYTQITW